MLSSVRACSSCSRAGLHRSVAPGSGDNAEQVASPPARKPPEFLQKALAIAYPQASVVVSRLNRPNRFTLGLGWSDVYGRRRPRLVVLCEMSLQVSFLFAWEATTHSAGAAVAYISWYFLRCKLRGFAPPGQFWSSTAIF